MAIDKNLIVDQALALLDDVGLEKLSLRTLATKLGIKAPSLYWHVESKALLLNMMAGSFYQRALESIPPELSWRQWLMAFGMGFHSLLLEHRDSALLCAFSAPSTEDTLKGFNALSAPLVAKGLSRSVALSYCGSVISLCTGWVLFEQQEGARKNLSMEMDLTESFMTGLKALVEGFPAV